MFFCINRIRRRYFMRVLALLRSLAKQLGVLCLCAHLIMTPSLVWAAQMLVIGHMQRFETDLGAAILVVDGIASDMRLGLTAQGSLTVAHFHAQTATLRYKADPPANKDRGAPALPQQIAIPLAFSLMHGQIDHLVITQAGRQQHIRDIRFDLSANPTQLTFQIQHANTAYGIVSSQFAMQNAYPFALHGDLRITQTAGDTPYHLQADVSGDLRTFHLHAAHQYSPQGAPYVIHPVAGSATPNVDTVVADATIHLDAPLTTELSLRLHAFQNKHLHPQLAGHTALRMEGHGGLAAGSTFEITLNSDDSRLQRQALVVTGQAQLLGGRLQTMALNAQHGQNMLRLNAHRDTRAPLTVDWQGDFRNLAQMMPGFAGQLSGQGHFAETSSATHWTSAYQLRGHDLQLPGGIVLQALQASGQFSDDVAAPLRQEVMLQGLRQQSSTGDTSPDINAHLQVTGSIAQHALQLQVNAEPIPAETMLTAPLPAKSTHAQAIQAKSFPAQSVPAEPMQGKPSKLTSLPHPSLYLSLTGSYLTPNWQGQLTQLQDQGGAVLALRQPATLAWSPQAGFTIRDMILNALQGEIKLQSLRYQPALAADPSQGQAQQKARFSTQGTLRALPIQALYQWLQAAPAVTLPDNHLRIEGDWQVQADTALRANIQLRQASGDWWLQKPESHAWEGLGLSQTSLALTTAQQSLQLNANLRSSQSGQLALSLRTPFTPTDNGFVISREAPLQGQFTGHLHRIAGLIQPLFGVACSGEAAWAIALSGSVGNPQLTGHVDGKTLGIRIPSQGIVLNEGQLQLAMVPGQVRVQQLQFSGEAGTLTGTGMATGSVSDWVLQLQLRLEKLKALSRVDRWLTLSGTTQLRLTQAGMQIGGDLATNAGYIELPKADKPTLDDDVVVLGHTNTPPRNAYAVSLDQLRLDFGAKPSLPLNELQHVLLRGQGLNAGVSGQLRLDGPLTQLDAAGTLDVSGTYLAYGQLLTIESGKLIFSGPITQVGLDVLATRQTDAYKVGIQLNGSAQTPQLKLVSTPETTNENKIALLVLGQPMANVGSNDLGVLSVAAGALLSQGDSVPLQSKIAQTLGLDTIDVRGTGATNYAVSVGKRINAKLTVGYEKSMLGLLNVGKLTYQLTKRIAIETRTGSDNALDVFYSVSFP